MLKALCHGLIVLSSGLLLVSCSRYAGPTDEQVSRDVSSFLQEKCQPLGAYTAIHSIVITGVRIDKRTIGARDAQFIVTAEGRPDAGSLRQGHIFSDYCPNAAEGRSRVEVNYTLHEGSWRFDGDLHAASQAGPSLATSSTGRP